LTRSILGAARDFFFVQQLREYIEKRLQEGRVEEAPPRTDEFPAAQFELASISIDPEGSEGEKDYRK